MWKGLWKAKGKNKPLLKKATKRSVTEANPGLTKEEKAKQEPKKKAAEA